MAGNRRPWRTSQASVCAAVGVVAIVMSGCSGTSTNPNRSGAASGAARSFAVGILTENLVDQTRPTPANGSVPAHPGRTLETTVLYPVAGTDRTALHRGATADRADGPYPLIAFAHGFGSSPDGYLAILQQWASAGYVVAAPRFPLTNDHAPGGPDLSDFANQPGDMGFVIDRLIAQTKVRGDPLQGAVDTRHIGAAGHSLGGVTVLGLVANTCCRDGRIDAAVVMSGDPIAFPTGRVDFGPAPPLLFVHGDADPTVPYVSSVNAYNAAHAPKGLLAVVHGDHGAPVNPQGPGFSSVVAATTAFFAAYLKHDAGALDLLRRAPVHGVTMLTLATTSGTVSTLPVPTVTRGNRQATVTPSSGLTDGQTVSVAWQGLTPGQNVNVLECAKNPPTAAGDCDLQSGKLLQPDPTGAGSLSLVVHTGAIGSGGGICDATHPGCVIAVNQGGSLDPAATVVVTIAFS